MSAKVPQGGAHDPAVQAAAEQALALVAEGMCVGLGSGRAASLFIERLGAQCRAGLSVRGVATSRASAEIALVSGVPLIALEAVELLDLTVDGADEVAPNLDLIKGWGGALVRERIVAAASKRQVIVVGTEKLVPALGARGKVPLEVVPFGRALVERRVRALGMAPALRMVEGGPQPFMTENGNLILDCVPAEPMPDGDAARRLEQVLLAIPGVVDTGLFLGTADQVLVGHSDRHVEVLRRPGG
ncbi:MAG TPA: ribose-5-phosphate isomerase RpiA [Gemmatimonadales bacterium]|nr:ribose-5-phosphate isomerase RpiA [Gemmatimonadales bacterium]